MRRAAGARVAGLLAVALAAAAVVVAWLRFRDPLAALPREAARDLPRVEDVLERKQGRLLTRVTLEGSVVGTVRFFVSRPDPTRTARVPLIVVVPGRRTAVEALSVLGDVGPNAVIWFVWPFPPDLRWARDLPPRIAGLRRDALSVPGQLEAVLGWARQQPWVDAERVSLLGFSLGALVVPAAQRLSQEQGEPVRWTVLAYGGAPIGALLAEIPGVRDSWLRPGIRVAADLLLRPLEPSLHLPHLRGRFLLLGGTADPSVPLDAAERMRELTPHPRTIILFEGEHIGVAAAKRKLLAPVVAATKSWLVEQGAIEPLRSRRAHRGRRSRPSPGTESGRVAARTSRGRPSRSPRCRLRHALAAEEWRRYVRCGCPR
jgi:dienelactone hydrolase